MRGRRNHGNLFIANLPADLPEARLAEAFDPYGIVLSAEIARDPNTGARLRHGWVDIATERAANAAIAGLHGTKLEGSRIEVRPSEKPVKKPGAVPARPSPARRPIPALPTMDTGAGAVPAPARQFVVEKRPLRRRVEPPAR
ncbi:MAG TPA: RNA-binding protein [Stellaceae bacterium]|nr:RNA-binding protein [Stellaceae bacterium]